MRAPTLFCLVICFFLYSTSYSQDDVTIQGTLKDSVGLPIQGASILVKKNVAGDLINYGVSNNDGIYLIEGLPFYHQYRIEIAHIAFSPLELDVEASPNKKVLKLNLVMKEKAAALDEVIIQTRRSVARQKGDTIAYNLRAYTSGNEQKLKDIINKLPGLEVDENGKLKANGEIIDNLLIDGKPFFGNNHKIATDNLDAKMVSGVELQQNYQEFDAIKELDPSNETALNIKIKEEYQGRITGNIEGFGAYDNRYLAHTNLYSFSKTLNVSFIADANDVGKSPIDIMDYLEMKIDGDLKNHPDFQSAIDPEPYDPFFLTADNKYRKKDSKFAALNLSASPLKNFVINIFSILDYENLFENSFDHKTFLLEGSTLEIQENLDQKKVFVLNENNLNVEYKPTAKSFISYSFAHHPIYNTQNSDIGSNVFATEQIIHQDIKNSGYQINHHLGYTSRVGQNNFWSLNAFFSTRRDVEELKLNSTQKLFFSNEEINQTKNSRMRNFGFYSNYTLRFNKNLLKFNIGVNNSISELSITSNSTYLGQPTLAHEFNYIYLSPLIERKDGFFQYKALLNFRRYHNTFKQSKNREWLFLPALTSKLSISQTHYLEIQYRRQTRYPTAQELNLSPFIENYFNYYDTSEAQYDRPILQNNFGVKYFYFNLFSGTLLLFNSSYFDLKDSIGRNTTFFESYNIHNFLIAKFSNVWTNLLKFETRLSQIKTKFKFDTTYLRSVERNKIEGKVNKMDTEYLSVRSSFQSYFKKSWINYEVGAEFSITKTRLELFPRKNQSQRYVPFLNLDGRISDNSSYYLNNSYHYFRNNSGMDREYFNLGIKVDYKATLESKMRFWIEGKNLLNMKNPEIIEIKNHNNTYSRNVITTLPGYIGIGLSYDI